MTVSDWIWLGSVVVAIGPSLVGLVWVTVAALRADGKDEV